MFTFAKEGVFYFSRRVQRRLRNQLISLRKVFSLRTKSARIAEARASRATDQLNEYWYHLRPRGVDLPGKRINHRLGRTIGKAAADLAPTLASFAVTLSEAVGIHLGHMGKRRPKTLHRSAERAGGYVIDACGNKTRQRPTS
ncbi:MAG: DUF6538 domain-containing protein [Limimaricola soesokkakensis]|uniref:DUF6538 domain-containing protein n=1 Tax=Limimaricola soesokkakensis TaxID=1343159 RepID=UPI004057D9DE